jgi:dGTPase
MYPLIMKNSFFNERCDENSPKWKQATNREIELYQRNNDIRSPFERDYTRLLHCQAYRRLKHKTQVFLLHITTTFVQEWNT